MLTRRDPSLHGWLVEGGLAGMRLSDLFDGFCRRLVASGFPLTRGYLSPAILHPLVWATEVTWQVGHIVDATDVAYGFETRDAWLVSPFRHMLETDTPRLHRPLARGDDALDFP
ncbi:MAG: hypothetical protein ACREUF_07255, partial [Solimonas sp.]